MAFVFTAGRKTLEIYCVFILKNLKYHKFCYSYDFIGNRTSCRPIQSVIILHTHDKLDIPLSGPLILFITQHMITGQIGLHSVLSTSRNAVYDICRLQTVDRRLQIAHRTLQTTDCRL